MRATNDPQALDVPIRPRDGLSEERKSSIRNALQKYRERVLERNLGALGQVIDEIESKPPRVPPLPPFSEREIECTEEEAPQKRIEYFRDGHYIWLDQEYPTTTTVSDFLSEGMRESLIRTNRLDGITHGEAPTAARNEWIHDVERRMSAAEGVPSRPDGLPADLKYLMTLVRGVCGPGLPQQRLHRYRQFLSDLDGDEASSTYRDGTEAGRITVPTFDIGDVYEEWDSQDGTYVVGMAVGIGSCSFAVYCREGEVDDSGAEDDDGEESIGKWHWKFGQQEMPTMSGLYDTIEDFLAWYAECSPEQ